MKLSSYNMGEAVEMLQARAFLLLMSDEVRSLDGKHAAAQWDLVGGFSEEQARQAIAAFDTTQ